MYLRLITKGTEVIAFLIQVYELLEPFYNDNRKLRMRDSKGEFSILYMDEFVDKLLNNEVVLDIVLPRIQKRQNLEEQGLIEPRRSVLEEELVQDEEQ
jgi:pre-mRNA-splicing factor 38A